MKKDCSRCRIDLASATVLRLNKGIEVKFYFTGGSKDDGLHNVFKDSRR